MNRARTPNTPFIPPLGSPGGSPAPVIPGQHSPNYSNYSSLPGGPAAYQYPNSPYATTTPFIPPGNIFTPGAASPSNLPLPTQSRASRQGVSHDYVGFPADNPYASPAMHSHPPMTPQHSSWGLPGPVQPTSPYTPWQHPASAPALYPTFNSPWGAPPPPLMSPWGPPGQGLPAFTPYGPAVNLPPGPHPGWGPPPPHGQFGPPPQAAPWAQTGHFPPPPPPRVPPAPVNPNERVDRIDPFIPGPHYGPVLEPFIARIVDAQIIMNPLIRPLPEDGSEHVYLNWNMLYPTSTVQRSDDKSYVSWLKGRDDPATFPRVTSLRLVSGTIPWMIEVKARNKDRGVMCGEVIETIAHELVKFSNAADFACLSTKDQREVANTYNHNRSRSPGVPGGTLGTGMKRLDFLRRSTMFAGIEKNDGAVRALTGDNLPCTFVLKCSTTFPMTKKEIDDREARGRASGSPSHRARSRANSTSTPSTTRIRVVSPSSTGSDDGEVDYD